MIIVIFFCLLLINSLEIAKANNRIIYLAYHSVFGVAYQAAKKIMLPLIQSGELEMLHPYHISTLCSCAFHFALPHTR